MRSVTLIDRAVQTRNRSEMVDITRLVQESLPTDMVRGYVIVYVPHTTAGITIQENADPDVVEDLKAFFSRLVPEDNRLYRHTIEGPDDMPAHIRAALTLTHVSIPVQGGKMALGTWQGVYLFEHRASSHRRSVALHLIGE